MQVGNARYRTASDIPELVPVFPLKGALLLPGGQLPLNILSHAISKWSKTRSLVSGLSR